MTITKHYCDYCQAEVKPEFATLFDASGRRHDGPAMKNVTFNWSGTFCGLECAGNFVANDGNAQAKEPEPQAKSGFKVGDLVAFHVGGPNAMEGVVTWICERKTGQHQHYKVLSEGKEFNVCWKDMASIKKVEPLPPTPPPTFEKAGGYGRCPKCGTVDHPGNQRERRIGGSTYCGACTDRSPSAQWAVPLVASEPIRTEVKDTPRVYHAGQWVEFYIPTVLSARQIRIGKIKWAATNSSEAGLYELTDSLGYFWRIEAKDIIGAVKAPSEDAPKPT